MSRVLVVFDLDDTLCHDGAWSPFPESPPVVAELRRQGAVCAVASNVHHWAQNLGRDTAERRVRQVAGKCGISARLVRTCAHHPAASCWCRKPRAGMLNDLRVTLGLDPKGPHWMVGDRWSDIAAGESLGWNTLLVGLDNWPWAQKGTTSLPDHLPAPHYIVRELKQVTGLIIGLTDLVSTRASGGESCPTQHPAEPA